MDAVTAGLTTPAPRVFGGPNSSFVGPAVFPIGQAVGDVVLLVMLTRRKVRSYYLGSLGSANDDGSSEASERVEFRSVYVYAAGHLIAQDRPDAQSRTGEGVTPLPLDRGG